MILGWTNRFWSPESCLNVRNRFLGVILTFLHNHLLAQLQIVTEIGPIEDRRNSGQSGSRFSLLWSQTRLLTLRADLNPDWPELLRSSIGPISATIWSWASRWLCRKVRIPPRNRFRTFKQLSGDRNRLVPASYTLVSKSRRPKKGKTPPPYLLQPWVLSY